MVYNQIMNPWIVTSWVGAVVVSILIVCLAVVMIASTVTEIRKGSLTRRSLKRMENGVAAVRPQQPYLKGVPRDDNDE